MVYATSPTVLFPDKPKIHFVPDEKQCPYCKNNLYVQKSREKDVFTLHIGRFRSCETVLECRNCTHFSNYGSEELLLIVPRRCHFGFDVMVYIGYALFLRHRCHHEIIAELAAQNIPISSGEIDYLAKNFIIYLAIVHKQNARTIKTAMTLNGGYILHLDSTCDKGSDMLMTGIDSITDFILGNVKIPSEKAEYIAPFLEEIKSNFGTPLAVVQDMGKGIMNAVEGIFPDIQIFICHFHFLRDMGKDLLEDDYDVIRKRLQKHGITGALHNLKKTLKKVIDEHPDLIDSIYNCVETGDIAESPLLELMPVISSHTLILWILEGKKQANGYGFPFDRMHVDFSVRILEGYNKLNELKILELRSKWEDNKPFHKLSCKLEKVANDAALKGAISRIKPKIDVFDKLRKAMKIADESGTKGLNDEGIDETIHTIKEKVTQFRSWMVKDMKLGENKNYTGFIAQLDKYWDKLFADPINVETPLGKIKIQPQRTNNIMEQFFRDFKRDHIKRTGKNTIGKTIRAMISETPLVKNLQNPEYMKIILRNKNSLEELFAQLDRTLVKQMLNKHRITQDKIPDKIKKIITKNDFPDIILNSFKQYLESSNVVNL